MKMKGRIVKIDPDTLIPYIEICKEKVNIEKIRNIQTLGLDVKAYLKSEYGKHAGCISRTLGL